MGPNRAVFVQSRGLGSDEAMKLDESVTWVPIIELIKSCVQNSGTTTSYNELPTSLSEAKKRSPSAEAISGASPISPPPQTYGHSLAPPTVEEAAALRHVHTQPKPTAIIPTSDPTADPKVRSQNAVWGGLRNALQTLHTSAIMFPPLQSAIGVLISSLEAASQNRQEYDDIASELGTLSRSLTRHIKESNSTRMSDCVTNVALSIEKQAKLISAKQERAAGRFIKAKTDEEEILRHYRRIEALFRQLQTDANLSTWSIANEQLVNTRLESLAPAKLATYDSVLSTEINRRTCTEGTRTAILSSMDEWSHDPNAPDLYWMDGMAGTGKSTIACSFSKALERRKQLAASFFCTRSSPECRQVGRIIPTIAYQLARYSIPFQGALCEILGNEPDIATRNVAKQVERLLKEPLDKVKWAIPDDLVVVIDALDECEDRHGVRLVLDLLFKFAPTLPLKFFVTSRPEPIIYTRMISQTASSRTVLHLHEIEKSLVKADIELYLREELSFMSPTDEEVEQLAGRSGNLFIYAATLARFIQPTTYSVDPQRRLSSVLAMTSQSTDQYAEVDALYVAVLESALGEKRLRPEEVEDMRLVLRTVLCVQEPVSVNTLAELAGVDTPRRVLSALQPLRSVVYFSESSSSVSTLHASFPDFMFSHARSGVFFCDRAEHNQLLARRCFEVMKSQLRFNICNLESSFIPDSEIVDLERRTGQAISPTLWYVCIYWGDHLRLAVNSVELSAVLEKFLSERLLFWMEVLNLKKRIGLGSQVLMKAKLWLQAGTARSDIIRLSDDAYSFITSYAANPVSQSTPHIYISSLLLSPRSNSVFKHYWGRTRGMINLKGSGMERRETAALATWTFSSPVRSIAYSPDGSQVSFGCDDGSLGIRNAYDGSPIIDTFKAHTAHIKSVGFSPSGNHIVSSSNDGTMRLWSTNDGAPVPRSFDGHTDEINSVAFSPDGSRIVSGSTDCTVRTWRAIDGAAVGDPFRGHAKPVLAIAISPDGTRIASSSTDGTIQVWNIDDHTLSFDPLTGHVNQVWSVDFSPDGTLIASGSEDHTARLWDACNGTPISGPLEGHTARVNSVVFTFDGKRLVSGSSDSTIRIWSTETHEHIAGPFEGHTDSILSVAFSPDGIRVVSASGDHTIRVWNTHESTPAASQSEGHRDGVWSVAYSPDGSHIISGSTDQTICLWDADSGKSITTFKGHSERVDSVQFSPDGTRIASGSTDCTIRVWDPQNGTPATDPITGHPETVTSIAFSPDGTRIASGSSDRIVRIWSLSTSTLIVGPLEGHTDVVMSVVFSPDGKCVASGSYDSTIRLWDSSNGVSNAAPFRGHTDRVMSVAFSPDGSLIASGSSDHTIRVWKDGHTIVAPFTGHTDTVYSVAFSPDGTCIASGSFDYSVRLWNSHDGTLIFSPLYGHSLWVTLVAFSPDGTRLVSGSIDRALRLWDIRQNQQIVSGFHHSAHSSSHPATSDTEAMDFTDWTVRNDGWVVRGDGSLLFWAPFELRRSFLTPRCALIISRDGMVEVDMRRALLGHQWRECYVS
ncbi:hypothetical protein CTheo_2965 [Ceratobasidium theobromae]|uniref:NACHT domain-containing protein n=1 Tax=Ceratobasidium theobromae TaxID=1582974 RepID=A0A5N5QQZ1_9AGAM|nr:hypothetical protein CTheo_2965 [Ceratobasidium theobromae]